MKNLSPMKFSSKLVHLIKFIVFKKKCRNNTNKNVKNDTNDAYYYLSIRDTDISKKANIIANECSKLYFIKRNK